MNITDKQRKKILWLSAAAVVVVYYTPSAVMSVRQFLFNREQAARRQAAPPAPKQPAPTPAVQPPPVLVPTQDPQFLKLVGPWMGATITETRGVCQIRLELAASQGKPGFTGYATMSCGSNIAFLPGKPTARTLTRSYLNQLTPVSTILVGDVQDGMLRLRLNQSIGNPPDGCFPSAVDLTPFGTAKLAAKWQDGPCPDSQMVMQRLPR